MYHDYDSAEELPDWSAWRASLPVSALLTADPPRLPEIRVVSPSPLLPPYSPSPSFADESDLEPDLAWIDSDEESDSDTELGSPDSDADLELDFPYSWLADRACFAALDTQLLMHPVQCFAEVCWAEAVNSGERGSMAVADSVSKARAEVQAIVAAGARRDWADERDPPAQPPLADELNTIADTSSQPKEVPFESFDAKFDAYYAYYARGASASPPSTPASTSTTTPATTPPASNLSRASTVRPAPEYEYTFDQKYLREKYLLDLRYVRGGADPSDSIGAFPSRPLVPSRRSKSKSKSSSAESDSKSNSMPRRLFALFQAPRV
ncbi:hypothetical protein DFH08DRAFT_494818 [Mycena albidolilacea]|uniref:Uncharacterized protein n=1 Tax=Mycena albidolilacea TaxID=1033008 RepID=A0AAD6Z4R8_9AGAR|nr:hypothetical protein DFH08DRAFT_494818 [Mycena albidolilacea]